ncbi:helix-turn-helix transcriptional regulator [Nocardioides sp. YIM 152588]|uniref:helix-turn-helix domain-containing protein n=1 Tax=Nocardioides sp. YIM 152588 TaxID=3158259 RepID=UPI0032E40A9E
MNAQDKVSVELLANALGSEKNVIERVRSELARRGWSQAELSRRMEAHAAGTTGGVIHPVVLSKLLGGDSGRHVSIDQLVTLAAVFEVTVAEMLLPPDSMAMAEVLRAMAEGPRLERARVLAEGTLATAASDVLAAQEVIARAMLSDGFWVSHIADALEDEVKAAEAQGRPPSDSIRVAFLAGVVQLYEDLKGSQSDG